MEKKIFNFQINFKENSENTGKFTAIFSRFNEVDKHGDITLPGAFTENQKVKISAWGHNWGSLPVGRGTIHSDNQKAWVDGQFFLNTPHGMDTYNTVKGLNELSEWSYGFEVLDSEMVEDNRVLKKMNVFEISPVLVGAGNNTSLEKIKSYKGSEAHLMLAEIKRLKSRNEAMDFLTEIQRLK